MFRQNLHPDSPTSLTAVFVLLTLALGGCSRIHDVPPPEPKPRHDLPDSPEQHPVERVYEVSADQSVLRIYVGREGPLARLGHNHVIINRDLMGTIYIHDKIQGSHAEIVIPVDQLLVDETEERRRAGDAYLSTPSEADKLATRNNMLRAGVLDGDRYPQVRIELTLLDMQGGQARFSVVIHFKEAQIALQIPARLTVEENSVEASAEFTLEHSRLGLEPYSVLGGMLRVAESIGFDIHIHAKTL